MSGPKNKMIAYSAQMFIKVLPKILKWHIQEEKDGLLTRFLHVSFKAYQKYLLFRPYYEWSW